MVKNVIKFIRVLSIIINNEVVNEYQTPYTNRERLTDIRRLRDKGYTYDKSKHCWCVTYDDDGHVQKHTIRYLKLKYI